MLEDRTRLLNMRKYQQVLHVALVVTVLLGMMESARAQKGLPIRFDDLNVVTKGERSSLSGECDGTTMSPEVTCRFTQLTVAYQLDPKELAAETEKRLVAVRTEIGSDPKKTVDKMCGEFRKNRTKMEREIQEIENPNTIKQLKAFIALCLDPTPTLAAFENLIRQGVLSETKTCRVTSFQNDPVTFKKVNPNKWVANVGPTGMCSSIYLYTMENDPKFTSLWKWSQVRTYADTSTEFCKGTQLNYKLEFGWKTNDIAMNCENIKFGR